MIFASPHPRWSVLLVIIVGSMSHFALDHDLDASPPPAAATQPLAHLDRDLALRYLEMGLETTVRDEKAGASRDRSNAIFERDRYLLTRGAQLAAALDDAELAQRFVEALMAFDEVDHQGSYRYEGMNWPPFLAASGEVEAVDAALLAAAGEGEVDSWERVLVARCYMLRTDGRAHAQTQLDAFITAVESGEVSRDALQSDLNALLNVAYSMERWGLIERYSYLLSSQKARVLHYASAAAGAATTDPATARGLIDRRVHGEWAEPKPGPEDETDPAAYALSLRRMAASQLAVAYAALGQADCSAEMVEVVREAMSEPGHHQSMAGLRARVASAGLAADRPREEVLAELRAIREEARVELVGLEQAVQAGEADASRLGFNTAVVTQQSVAGVQAGDDAGVAGWVESLDDPRLRAAAAIGAAEGLLVRRRHAVEGVGGDAAAAKGEAGADVRR